MLKLKDIYKPAPITDADHVITFGKYSGKTVAFVMEADPQWLWWAHHETDRFELNYDLLEQVEEAVEYFQP